MASLNSWEYLCSQYDRICHLCIYNLHCTISFSAFFRHEQEVTKLHHLLKNKEEETREQELQLRVRIFLSVLFSLFYTFWTIVHQWDQWYPYFRIELTHLHISCRPVNSSCLKLFCMREIWGLMGVIPKNGFCTQFCHVHLHKLLLFMRLQTQNLK